MPCLLGCKVALTRCLCVFTCLCVCLQGVREEDTSKVEELIMDTLRTLRGQHFSQSAVEAAVNTIEFSLR